MTPFLIAGLVIGDAAKSGQFCTLVNATRTNGTLKATILEISECLAGGAQQASKSLYFLLSNHPLSSGEGNPPSEAGKVVPRVQVQEYGEVISQFGWNRLG
jgi:hypothetical protein